MMDPLSVHDRAKTMDFLPNSGNISEDPPTTESGHRHPLSGNRPTSLCTKESHIWERRVRRAILAQGFSLSWLGWISRRAVAAW